MISRGVIALALSCLGVGPAVAQQPTIALRFTPVLGARVHRVFQTHRRVTITGAAGGATAGPRIRESAELGGLTEVAVAGSDGRPVLHVTFDSLRVRRRDGTGSPWQEVIPTGVSGWWLQLRLDEHMRVEREVTGSATPDVAHLIQTVTGTSGLVLPERPVRAGDRWETEFPAPAAALPQPADGMMGETLWATAIVTVDSVVPRANDTLAFLGIRGTFPAEIVRDSVTASYAGGLSGSLVWSTGWRTFVSGVTRVRLRVHLGGGSALSPSGIDMVLERTIRHQVRS